MTKRLAIMDWGIGGISVFKLIKEKLGRIPVVYLSDTGATPYGKMSREELVSRLNAAIIFLKSLNVTHLVIGCNAASTAIAELDLQGLIVEGMIDNAIAETVCCEPSRLGVIGGRRTVLSGVYRRGFAEKGISVRQRIAQPLSGLIEGGDTGSETLQSEAKRILRPIRNSSHILLACTHYPAITEVLRSFVAPDTEFIDPASSIVRKVEAWNLPRSGGDTFLTTGDPEAMRNAALSAFGVELGEVVRITF